MQKPFDAAAMHPLKLGEAVADTVATVSLVADGQVRQRCASARLAAQIVSRAYRISADLEDGQALAGMAEVLKRLAAVRQMCLVQIGLGQLDVSAARKLATLQAVPMMMGLVNLFDYYVMDADALTFRLVYAVAAQAEFHALQGVEGLSEFGQTLMIQRAYGVSAGVMVEVYKTCAVKDAQKLRDMQEIDRSFASANYERLGGMSFEHVLSEHDRVMRKTYEVCGLIVTAQAGRKESGDDDK